MIMTIAYISVCVLLVLVAGFLAFVRDENELAGIVLVVGYFSVTTVTAFLAILWA